MPTYAMDIDLRERGLGHYREPWALRERLRIARQLRWRDEGRATAARVAILAGAYAVLSNGKPYIAHFSEEGDGESGPMAWDEVGYRWGQMRLVLHRDGCVSLIRARNDRDGFARYWDWVHLSNATNRSDAYVGQSAMIRDHLTALKSNIQRNGVEFAMTGKRPPSKPYVGEVPKPSIVEQERVGVRKYRVVRGHGINE